MSCFVKIMFINFCVFYKALANQAFVFPQITFFSSKIFCLSAQQHEHQQVFRYFSTLSLLTCSTDVGRDKFSCRHDRKIVGDFLHQLHEYFVLGFIKRHACYVGTCGVLTKLMLISTQCKNSSFGLGIA